MKFINSKQLAFILDIQKEDARAKMCTAWAKSQGIENAAEWSKTGKIIDVYPVTMEVEMLAKELNIPTLSQMILDVADNYLKRPAYKKWILCDYPEKEIKKCKESGKPFKLSIPTGLRSLLSDADLNVIKSEWRTRFPNTRVI
jgi:hypothetical protein